MNKKSERRKRRVKKQPQIRFARSLFTLVLGLIFLGGVAVFASKGGETLLSYLRPSVKVELSGTVNRDSGKIELSKAGQVMPGEILEWKIASENSGDGNATGYKAMGQIPVGTEFVAGSAHAQGSPSVEYSIDGGQSFSKKPMIKEKQSDGSEKLVPAPARMYTQVRFDWNKSLGSGEKFDAFYSVRVK
jgi:uncharacterized repeat protein (TIGR01451 family)